MPNRTLTTLSFACALSAWAATPAPAAQPAAPTFEVNVERVAGTDSAHGGKVYRIAASGTVTAAPSVAWRTLTDYDHLADFVPDLQSARVLSRDGDKVVVEQLGTARFLFFSQPIHLVVRVHEQAPDRIDIGLVEGDMKVYRAGWTLVPLAGDGGTKVVYNAVIEPDFFVPAMVGTRLVKSDIGRMMAAVLARIERQK
jgi:ribosome-associated toxin RatA of RatAB toxin-antitoxin module